MKYRSLAFREAEKYVNTLNRTSDVSSIKHTPAGTVRGDGVDCHQVLVEACRPLLASIKRSKGTSLDSIEGALSLDFYHALSRLDPVALNDLGFWRHLACNYLRDFVIWRDGSRKVTASEGGFGARQSTSAFQDCVPYRMFRRGQIAALAKIGSMTPDQIARIEGTDLWRSHVLRIKLGNSPTAAAAFLIIADKMRKGEVSLTDLVREAAKLVQRLNTNLIMGVLDETDAFELLKPEFDAALPLAIASRKAKDEVKRAKSESKKTAPKSRRGKASRSVRGKTKK